jgi:hypothetical protein
MHKGQKVEVYNNSFGGTRIFEGIATLVKQLESTSYQHERWLVKFPNDSEIYERNIKIK